MSRHYPRQATNKCLVAKNDPTAEYGAHYCQLNRGHHGPHDYEWKHEDYS